MVRSENIAAKLDYLRNILKKLEKFKTISTEEMFGDSIMTAALERYLFLAAQASIDAVEMFCKLKQLGRPGSMSESIRLLQNANIIEEAFADTLTRMVGFRNYLSHGYEQIDQKIMLDVLHIHLLDLEKLARILEEMM